MSAISTDGMDKWLDDAYPDLDRRKANMIYEIASLIKDDPDTAPVLIEELVEIMFDEQIDYLEDDELHKIWNIIEIAMEREGYDVQNAELSMRLYDPELTETIGFYNK